jgi:hypothetical protein
VVEPTHLFELFHAHGIIDPLHCTHIATWTMAVTVNDAQAANGQDNAVGVLMM